MHGNFHFHGAKALPTLSGDGAILHYRNYFYKLICTNRSCNWRKIDLEVNHSLYGGILMYLPPALIC